MDIPKLIEKMAEPDEEDEDESTPIYNYLNPVNAWRRIRDERSEKLTIIDQHLGYELMDTEAPELLEARYEEIMEDAGLDPESSEEAKMYARDLESGLDEDYNLMTLL